MKKTMKKIAALIFAVILAVSCSYFAQAAGNYVWDTTVSATYYQTSARKELFNLLNNFRVKNNKSRLVYDPELEEVAMIRAAEIQSKWAHERIDGSYFDTLMNEIVGDYWSCGENIQYGSSSYSYQDMQTSYENSPEHRANMLDDYFGSVGLGLARIGGYFYYVQIFADGGKEVTLPSIPDGTNKSFNVTYEFKSVTITPSASSVSVIKGNEITVPTCTVKTVFTDDKEGSGETSTCTPAWQSSDPSIATVSNGKIKGVGTGTAELTADVYGKPVSVNVTVNPPVLNSISVSQSPNKTQYYVGDDINDIDLWGLKLTANWTDGNREVAWFNDVTISSFDFSSPGQKKITVSYNNKTASFNVNVAKVEISSVSLCSKPFKTKYYLGIDSKFDPYGITMQVIYNNGDSILDSNNIVCTNTVDFSKLGKQTINCKYLNAYTQSFDVYTYDVSSLTLEDNSRKKYYMYDNKYLPTEVLANATYSDDTVHPVLAKLSSIDVTTPGAHTATATYRNKSVNYYYDVINVESVSLKGTLQKRDYYLSEKTLDTSGLYIEITYADGTVRTVSDFSCIGFTTSTIGEKTITVKYFDRTFTFKINVTDGDCVRIAKNNMGWRPQTNYPLGAELNLQNMVFDVEYKNGTVKRSSAELGFCTFTGFDSSTPGTKTVTLHYLGASLDFTVNVYDITKIEPRNPKTDYYVTDGSFSKPDAEVTLTNGEAYLIDRNDLTFTSIPDMTNPGDQTVTMSYMGKTASYTIHIYAPEKIEVVSVPDKTEYFSSETELDARGLEVEVTFTNGTVRSYGYSSFAYSCDLSQPGRQTVTAGYKNYYISNAFTAEFEINVVPVIATEISIEQYPSKLSYYTSDTELDLSGFVLYAKYNDGLEGTVTTNYLVKAVDLSKAGKKTVVIEYGEAKTSFEIDVIQVEPVSLVITSNPTKTSYFTSDTAVNTAGLVLTLTNNDGSTETVTSGFTTSAVDFSTAGTKDVAVTYKGKTATFRITVVAVAPESLAVKTSPTKTSYFTSDTALDTTGLVLTLTNNDGSTETVTSGFTTSAVDFSTAGTKDVTVTYKGKTTQFRITVVAVAPVSLAVKTDPTKKSYFTSDTAVNTAGLVLTLTNNDGSTETVTSGFTTSAVDFSTAGTKDVTVTYKGKTTQFRITVVAVAPVSLAVKTQPTKTSYFTSDTAVNTAGLVLTLTNNDGSTETVTSGFTTSAVDFTTAGTKDVTVTYKGKTATFQITVVAVAPVSLAVKTDPTKKSYFTSDTAVNTTGLVLTLTNNDGSTETVTSGFTTSAVDFTTAGPKTVTVTYKGKTATFQITVAAVAPESLAVKTGPTKTSYFTSDTAVNTTGLVLTLTNNDGSTETVTSGFTTSAVDFSTAGTKDVTVTYKGKTTQFRITVVAVAPESLAVKTSPTKTSYFTSDTALDTTGLELVLTYNDGSTEIVTEGYTCSGYNLAQQGVQNVTVSCNDKTATFNISVTAVRPIAITIRTLPVKKTYYMSETSLDVTGLTLYLVYNNGTDMLITYGFICSGYNPSSSGSQYITVSYQGFKTKFVINVIQVQPEALYIKTPPINTTYFTSSKELDTSGLSLILKYNDGSTETVNSNFTCHGYDFSATGLQTVTVAYRQKTTSFNIYVNQVSPVQCMITGPEKTSYYTSDTELDISGLSVRIKYNDGTVETLTDGFYCTGYNLAKAGTQTVNVYCKGQKNAFQITVIEVEAVSLEIVQKATREKYYTSTAAYDPEGMILKVTYNDDSEKMVTEGFECSGYDNSKTGICTITITYENVSVTTDIRIVKVATEKIEITSLPQKLVYRPDEAVIDSTGLVIKVIYNDGSVIENVTEGFICSGLNSSTSGEKRITVKYDGKIAYYGITVLERADYSGVNAAIAEAETYIGCSQYPFIDSTYESLYNVIGSVNFSLTADEQKQVDAYETAIRQAQNNLIRYEIHDGIKYLEVKPNTKRLESGYYFLPEDVTIENDLYIIGDVKLCLNGYKLNNEGKQIYVNRDYSLEITDCGKTGEIITTVIVNYGKIKMMSGKINASYIGIQNDYSNTNNIILEGSPDINGKFADIDIGYSKIELSGPLSDTHYSVIARYSEPSIDRNVVICENWSEYMKASDADKYFSWRESTKYNIAFRKGAVAAVYPDIVEAKKNSGATVEQENRLIYGVDYKSKSLDNSISVLLDEGWYECDSYVTGGQVKINNYDNGLKYHGYYTLVVFGDVNGDGLYDAMDAMMVNCIVNGMLTEKDLTPAQWKAADCNHDGVINQLDVYLLEQAGVLYADVSQTKDGESGHTEIGVKGALAGGIFYTFDAETGVLAISGTGAIPSYSSADNSIFAGLELSEIIIGEGITEIGSFAFADCEIGTVTLPKSIESIQDNAFADATVEKIILCCDITELNEFDLYIGETGNEVIGDDKIQYLITDQVSDTITACFNSETATLTFSGTGAMPDYSPESPDTYGHYSRISEIKNVVFEEGITHIGDYTLVMCDGIESITLPDSLESIGEGAFVFAEGLKTVTLGKNVSEIGDAAFGACYALEEFNASDENTTFCSIDGVLYSKDKKELVLFPAGKNASEYTIIDGTEKIGTAAFLECDKLTSVTIPTSVTVIENNAFDGTDNLKTVYYPGNRAEWESITIVDSNTSFRNADIIFLNDATNA